jgi:hypothetical protein
LESHYRIDNIVQLAALIHLYTWRNISLVNFRKQKTTRTHATSKNKSYLYVDSILNPILFD